MFRTVGILGFALALLAGCDEGNDTLTSEQACRDIIIEFCGRAQFCGDVQLTQTCQDGQASLRAECAAAYPRQQGIPPREATSCANAVRSLTCETSSFCGRNVPLQCGLSTTDGGGGLNVRIVCPGVSYDGGIG